MTRVELLRKLETKFGPPAHVCLTELPNAAGFFASRRADALAVGLFPSRGCEISGFELKTSRADWLAELRQPQKAEAFFAVCDRWYLVVADKAIVETGELPPMWGLIIPYGRGLRIHQKAPKLDPIPVDRLLLAAMFRKLLRVDMLDNEVRQLYETAYQKGLEEGRKTDERAAERATNTLRRLEEKIKNFQDVSGVNLYNYNAGNIGRAVRMVLANEAGYAERALRQLKDTLGRFDREIANILNDRGPT